MQFCKLDDICKNIFVYGQEEGAILFIGTIFSHILSKNKQQKIFVKFRIKTQKHNYA